jgi:hypothetical protein
MELRSNITRLFTVVCVYPTRDLAKEFRVTSVENHADALRSAMNLFDEFVSRTSPEHHEYDMDIVEVLLIMEDITRLGSNEVKLAFWPEENFINFIPDETN